MDSIRSRPVFVSFVAWVLLWPANPAAGQVGSRRFHTDRPGPRALALPDEDEAFSFVIYGDRTGGPAEGIEILRQAVADTVLLDPDLVMTVGDLVQGYNTTAGWLPQMREYHEVMSGLGMPWFPVAGNHDIYWRGEGRPGGEHEQDYETHFGPLWYAVQHKGCWFIVLYTDEGNPQTDERDFNKPECQQMSPQQFDWLRRTLEKTGTARHVFVFLHHPRWQTERYGQGWEPVHQLLRDSGNVTAVFAGHIHRMQYDGKRDGIEYFTLATVGGVLHDQIPAAGYLHQMHLVTVRDEGIQLACLPVGSVIDPRAIPGDVSGDVGRVSGGLPRRMGVAAVLEGDGSMDTEISIALKNPGRRPVEMTLTPVTGDRRFRFEPDHAHAVVQPGEEWTQRMRIRRPAGGLDAGFGLPELELVCDYLAEGLRITLPARRIELVLPPPRLKVADDSRPDRLLSLSGQGDCLRLDSRYLHLPDGPLTVEAWLRGRDFEGRRALLAKAENSEFGLFVSDGRPEFIVHLNGRYVRAVADEALLAADRWHHLAGVFDGEEVRLYLDGRRIGAAPGQGSRTANPMPLFVGADPDRRGRPMSFFDGWIDGVRLSSVARYSGEQVEVPGRSPVDESTVLQVEMDDMLGPWFLDRSGNGSHPQVVGAAYQGDRTR